MKKGKLGALILVIAFCCVASSAHAIMINIMPNLTLSQSAPIGQPAQGACIIGDPSCAAVNGTVNGFFTLLPPGNPGSYLDVFSPLYTVAEVMSAIGGFSMFSIGIDINTAPSAGPHELQTFVAEVNGVQQYAYLGSGGTFGGTALTPLNNNGTGMSDWQLGIFDLTPFASTDNIRFGVDLLNVSPGREQLFLFDGFGDTVDVPEPASMMLMGLGLVGLGLTRRKRKTS